MKDQLQRRVNIATCWASSRIALLDSIENYEDSYAITEEFREWITCIGEHPEHLKDSVLNVPHFLGPLSEEISGTDEKLEI